MNQFKCGSWKQKIILLKTDFRPKARIPKRKRRRKPASETDARPRKENSKIKKNTKDTDFHSF